MYARTPTLIASLAVGAGLIAMTGGAARAELDEAGKEIERGLAEFQSATQAGKDSGESVAHYFHRPVADCHALVARGKELGIKPSQEMWGSPDKYLFKRAGEKCDEYGVWKQLVEAAAYLTEARTHHQIALGMKPGEVSGEWAQNYGKVGSDCLVEIDRRIAAGLATDLPVKIGGEERTIADARATYCQGLVDWAGGFAAETERVRAEELAKITAKYTKYGIKGDRLALLVDSDNTYFYGKGCDEVITDIAKLAKAKVLFYWTELAYGAGWGVRRYQFKGHKLVKESYREFSRQEAAYKWCK